MEPRATSARRVAITSLGVLLLVTAVSGLLYGPQAFIVLKLRKTLPHDQSLYAMPEQLISTESSEGLGTTLSYFGYQFEVPWIGVENQYQGPSLVVVRFNSGQVVMFQNPMETLKILKATRKVFEAWGNTAALSNYSAYDYVLHVTPRQMSVFMPRQEAVRVAALLPIKYAFAYKSESGLYSFDWANIKGFQCGSPGLTRTIIVNAFDRNDAPIQLIFSTKDGSQAVLSQSDINRVLTTIRLSPPPNN